MASKPKPVPATPVTPAADIRASKPYLFAGSPLKLLVLRGGSIAALLLCDLCGLALGLYGALTLSWIYHGTTPILWGVIWDGETRWLPFLSLITVLVFWQAHLYAPRERRAGFGRVLSSLVIVALLALAFGLGTGHNFGTFGLVPTTLLLTALFTGLFRASYETATRDALRRLGVRRRAVLVGEGDHLVHLYRTLGSNRGGIDYEFIGALTAGEGPVGLPVLGTVDDIRSVLAGLEVDELIVTDSDFSEKQLLEMVDQAHRGGVKVQVAPKTTELLIQRAEYVPEQGLPLFQLRPPVFAGADWAVKRVFDVVVAGAIALIGLPLWLAIAAAIKLGSRGPVFYRDRRIGLNEQEFGMLKFRTMHEGAADKQAELERLNEAGGALFKIRDDPRMTRVGRLLRRASIDEIPNVINVLRGEMSLVGPRPLPVRDHELLEEWHRKRNLVLPGMTGLWQISRGSSLSFDDLVRLDFYYLDNWSIWLDISILAKTLPAVLAQRGAY